jgi:hypothetical protein
MNIGIVGWRDLASKVILVVDGSQTFVSSRNTGAIEGGRENNVSKKISLL